MNFYNEIDPFAADWLRALIRDGHIAPGVVDERSIEDIQPNELQQYKQCHFFAGIGVWSYALRCAGWPDDKPVWTGSCPCQPYSSAGRGQGFADERHLWPAWFHLIRECKPVTLFGEQVENSIRHGWLDLVQSDLEGIGYTVGAVGLPACAFGAPHMRKRLYFVAHAERERLSGLSKGQWLSQSAVSPFPERINSALKPWRQMATSHECVPSADGASLSLARKSLHAYGNAIVAQTAQAFIEAAIKEGQ